MCTHFMSWGPPRWAPTTIKCSTSTQQGGPKQAHSLLTPWERLNLPPQQSKILKGEHIAFSLRMMEPSISTQQGGPRQAHSLLLENNQTSTSTQQGGPRHAHSLVLENNRTSTSTQQSGPMQAHRLLLLNDSTFHLNTAKWAKAST